MKAIFIHALVLLLGLADFAAAADLPRVLVLGDTVLQAPARALQAEFKGRATVEWKHPGSTGTALARIDELLGAGKWDLIYFNFGQADLHYRDPATQSVRVLSRFAGGVRVTPPDSYERNLGELVTRLKAGGATLIWASTTPLPGPDDLYDTGSEIEYNAIAARVMSRHEVRIHDLHALAAGKPEARRRPNRVVQPLQQAISPVIAGALGLPAPEPAKQ